MNTYTIRQLSEQFQIPSSTLRYYEEIGLLQNVIHTEKGQRIYQEEHVDRLNAIACFKKTGLSIDGMLSFFTYEKELEQNIEQIVQLVKQHESDIIRKIEELEDGLSHIRHKVWYYEAIKQAIQDKCDWPNWDDYIGQ